MVKKPERNEELFKAELRKLLSTEELSIHDYYGEHAKFGVVSDTHLGNIYTNRALQHLAYKTFKKEGIDTVYHCGDVCDGEKMYRGQEYELYAIGADAQVNDVVKRYPQFDGIDTFFITGNHDLSHWKNSGTDIGERIDEKRKDIHYLGQEEADIALNKSGHPRIRLSHPGKGTSYAISYHPQKYIESLSGGQKPDAVFMGHYHKAEHIPSLRNVQVIQAGCLQRQTSFMRRNNNAAHQGFWIIDMFMSKRGKPKRFKGEFFPYYERRKYTVVDEEL